MSRSSKSHAGKQRRSPIKAAGGVVWREGSDGREVLLVHRPKYDDWSLPKGKLHSSEPAPLAAIREIEEETACRVRLGPELRTASYAVSGVPKEVRYWLADPVAETPFVPGSEVDEIAWVTPAAARRVLRPFDSSLVRSAVQAARPSSALLVVRHGKSMPRKEWKGEDADRPLNREGEAQAQRLSKLLRAWAPSRVVSSTSRRCRDTVAPYAEASGLKLELVDALSEESFEDDPKTAKALLAELRDSPDPIVVCTHRPLLAMTADLIGLKLAAKTRSNPMPKGAFWVAHGGKAHPVERHRP